MATKGSGSIQTPITDFINRTITSTGVPVENLANYKNSNSLVLLFKVVDCYKKETGKDIAPSNVVGSTKGLTATFGRKGVNIKKVEKCVNCSPSKVNLKVDDKKNTIVVKI